MDTLVNGSARSTISVFDRGLLYGDGVFETLAVREGNPVRWSWHMERLDAGCTALGIPFPAESLLCAEALQLCGDRGRSVLKIIITRGPGARGYLAPEQPEVTRILYLSPWPEISHSTVRDGARLRLCQYPLPADGGLSGIKHLNRLPQVLARSEWRDPDYMDGLMLDTSGNLVEATSSNIFLVESGMLRTPDLATAGIPGIMRRQVLELARESGISCHTGTETLQSLATAEEVFLTNSIIGILPVRQVDQFKFEVGPVTRRLQGMLEEFH